MEVRGALWILGFCGIFITSDWMYLPDNMRFTHGHAALIACFLYHRFPVHNSINPDAGRLNGSVSTALKDIAITGQVRVGKTDGAGNRTTFRLFRLLS
jgi:hypothetical protein